MVEHIMELYEEALEELMDAQKYVRLMEDAGSDEAKSTYRTLAKQELDHAHMIVQLGDRYHAKAVTGESGAVWHHLKKHLTRWHSNIEREING